MRAFKFYREESLAVSSLFDSRRIVRTHARRFQANLYTIKKADSVGLDLAKAALVVTRLTTRPPKAPAIYSLGQPGTKPGCFGRTRVPYKTFKITWY